MQIGRSPFGIAEFRQGSDGLWRALIRQRRKRSTYYALCWLLPAARQRFLFVRSARTEERARQGSQGFGRAVQIHRLLLAGYENRIDPDAWRPLIMSFSQFYGLGGRVHTSRLAEIPESAYRPRPRSAEPAA